jgi:hypothetical protein
MCQLHWIVTCMFYFVSNIYAFRFIQIYIYIYVANPKYIPLSQNNQSVSGVEAKLRFRSTEELDQLPELMRLRDQKVRP